MSILKEYDGMIHVEDYKLVDHGDGNGFGIRSENCAILNDVETKVHNGLIELTLAHASMSRALSLGSAERFILTAEDAEEIIQALQEAQEQADADQWELRERNEKREQAKTK